MAMEALIREPFSLHTEDFRFHAVAPAGDGSYTRFMFRDIDIHDYLALVNDHQLDALSLWYQFSPHDVDLNLFRGLEHLEALGFALETPVKVSVSEQTWARIRLKHLQLLGSFAPGLDFSNKVEDLKEVLFVNHPVYEQLHASLVKTRALELQSAPKSWSAEELGHFKQLNHLKLNACGLNKLPDSWADSPLELLILAGCRGLGNVDVLKQMKHLKYLFIYTCPRIKDYSFLQHMPQLKALFVSKPIEGIDLHALPGLDLYQVDHPKARDQSFTRNGGERFLQVGTMPLDDKFASGLFTRY